MGKKIETHDHTLYTLLADKQVPMPPPPPLNPDSGRVKICRVGM